MKQVPHKAQQICRVTDQIQSPGTCAPLEWLHYIRTSNHKRNLNSQVSDCTGRKTTVPCSKNIMISLTQSVPEECGLHFVWTFSPNLDCTIIWAAFNARNLVNLSKSFLSWILSLTVAIFRICINLIYHTHLVSAHLQVVSQTQPKTKFLRCHLHSDLRYLLAPPRQTPTLWCLHSFISTNYQKFVTHTSFLQTAQDNGTKDMSLKWQDIMKISFTLPTIRSHNQPLPLYTQKPGSAHHSSIRMRALPLTLV